MTLRAALIVDNLALTKWQQEALLEASDLFELKLVLNCSNTQTKKKIAKNFFYYVLNYLSLKNSMTRKHRLSKIDANILNFESIYEGSWQKIPSAFIEQLEVEKIDIVIKFGMGLLHIDEALSQYGILSFHHGNPSKYRGRPAGFYEILNGEKTSGVIVQKLTHELDAGEVYAYADAKVVNYSYKKTALNFYSISRFLLRKAIINVTNKAPVEISKKGENYRLPSNYTVLRFTILLIRNLFKKLIYGAFFEKRWKVAMGSQPWSPSAKNIFSKKDFNEIPIADHYNFYADPFFSHDGSLLRFEALGNKTGQGDIVEAHIHDLRRQRVILSGRHYSYPFAFSDKNEEYLLPEVASHSAQYFYSICSGHSSKTILKGLEKHRIVDATLYNHEVCWYLFFGMNQDAHTVLNLWISDDLLNTFIPHPNSPIAINPSSARMGGALMIREGSLYRLGQNNEGEYGKSLTILKIIEITPEKYHEVSSGSLSMSDASGPHSLNLNTHQSKIVIDYYEDRFSFLAGIRRVIAKLLSTFLPG